MGKPRSLDELDEIGLEEEAAALNKLMDQVTCLQHCAKKGLIGRPSSFALHTCKENLPQNWTHCIVM